MKLFISTLHLSSGPTTSLLTFLARSACASATRELVSRVKCRICCHPSLPDPPSARVESAAPGEFGSDPEEVEEAGRGMKMEDSARGVAMGVVPGVESFLSEIECA